MKKILLLIFFIQFFSLYSEKKQIGEIVFSWDVAGEFELVAKYEDEEIHPLFCWHVSDGCYRSNQAKAQQSKLIRSGKLMAGGLYRVNQIKFSFWEYFKSFFCKPKQLNFQKYVIFDDGTGKYYGPKGKREIFFSRKASNFFAEWEKLRKMKTT